MVLEKGLTIRELATHYRVSVSLMYNRIGVIGVKKLKYEKPHEYYLSDVEEALKNRVLKKDQNKIDRKQKISKTEERRLYKIRQRRIDKCPNETMKYLKRYYNIVSDIEFSVLIGVSRKSLWEMMKYDRVPKVYKLLVEEIKKKGE